MQSLYSSSSLKQRMGRWMWQRKFALSMLLIGATLLANSTYIHAKAILAQWLIKDAWHETLVLHQPVSPWSWADTYPVAKLTLDGKEIYVLSGVSGRVMAFGPGHLSHSPLPGETGNAVITGHRDTHFAVLADLKEGDVIDTQTEKGSSQYQVTDMRIVHQSQMSVTQDSDEALLTLITCYPFKDTNPNTPWRYMVKSQRI